MYTGTSKVWLFGGGRSLDDFYELNMHSLAWTMIENIRAIRIPYYSNTRDSNNTFTAITENRLFMQHGILDIPSMSWRKCSTAVDKYYVPSIYHTCTRGINSSVMIIGGRYIPHPYDPCKKSEPWKTIHMILETKSLQQVAIQTIWKHKHTLPWQERLPRKLISLFGFLGDFQVQHRDTVISDS